MIALGPKNEVAIRVAGRLAHPASFGGFPARLTREARPHEQAVVLSNPQLNTERGSRGVDHIPVGREFLAALTDRDADRVRKGLGVRFGHPE